MKTIYKLPDGRRLDVRKPSHLKFIEQLKREIQLPVEKMKTIYKLPDGGRLERRKPSDQEFFESLKREIESGKQELARLRSFSSGLSESNASLNPLTSSTFPHSQTRPRTGYVYHSMSCKTIQGVADELNKRDLEGWEFVAVFWGGGGTFGGNEYGVVVRKPR